MIFCVPWRLYNTLVEAKTSITIVPYTINAIFKLYDFLCSSVKLHMMFHIVILQNLAKILSLILCRC